MTLCRGVDVDTNKWVIGYYVCLNDEEHRIYSGYAETDCGDYYPDYHRVYPETVGRYIGFDINGEDIFEGDIIRFYDEESLRFIVRYGAYDKIVGFTCFYGIGFYLERIGEPEHIQPFGLIPIEDMWKIGNVFENYELLE